MDLFFHRRCYVYAYDRQTNFKYFVFQSCDTDKLYIPINQRTIIVNLLPSSVINTGFYHLKLALKVSYFHGRKTFSNGINHSKLTRFSNQQLFTRFLLQHNRAAIKGHFSKLPLLFYLLAAFSQTAFPFKYPQIELGAQMRRFSNRSMLSWMHPYRVLHLSDNFLFTLPLSCPETRKERI